MVTDWAGSSMRVDALTPDYQATIGGFAEHVRGDAKGAQSDPIKVAKALLALASEKEPPLRILFGSDAVFVAELAAKARAQEDAKWRAVSLSTDADGRTNFADTPIAKFLLGQRG